MPLPLDLASVAWLAMNQHHTRIVTLGWMGSAWVSFADYRATKADTARAARRAGDLAKVVRDQKAYIRELEAMVRPNLVQPIGEQDGLAL